MDTLKSCLNSTESFIKTKPVTTAALATAAAVFVVTYQDYRFYVSMGPYGLPDTFSGWRTQLHMTRIARKDTLVVPPPYELAKAAEANGPGSEKSFFSKPLSARPGSRPDVPNFVAPQRQTTARSSEAMKKEMNAYLDALVYANPKLLQRLNSRLEGPVPAVQLRDDVPIPPSAKTTKGEIIHVQPPDGSTHVVLSLADSAEVIESGWGQRHRLSGAVLTWGYTLVYAPRDEQDFAVWKEIMAATVRFACAEIGHVQLPASA